MICKSAPWICDAASWVYGFCGAASWIYVAALRCFFLLYSWSPMVLTQPQGEIFSLNCNQLYQT